MNLWSYSPEQVQVLVGGFYEVVGLATGTFVEVEKDTMPVTVQRTTDGYIARKRTTNSSYTIRISVMSTSPANNLFTRLQWFDGQTNLGKFPLLIKDNSGSGWFFSATTWVEQIPSLKYSTDVDTNVWVLRSSQGEMNIGGNDPQTNIQDIADLALSGLPYIQRVLEGIGG